MNFEQHLPETIVEMAETLGLKVCDENMEWSKDIQALSVNDFFVCMDGIEEEAGFPLFTYN
jgi:hypothetical protein